MAEPALCFSNVGVARDTRCILADVSFTADRGSLVAILGPNGAGKSTLLKATAGLLRHEGVIQILGTDARLLSRGERARRMAYVPQHSALDAALLVRDVVAQGRYTHRDGWGRSSAADEQAIFRALSLCGMNAFADRAFSRLSYGERRLVLLARALATGAEVLLLDEPTAALDVAHALSLLGVLRNLADRGACVVAVLHHLHEAMSVADRAVLIAQGRCVAAGEPAEVIEAGTIRRVFGVNLVPAGSFGYRLAEDKAP